MNSVAIPPRCLGVVIPVYNEEKTLHIIVGKVLSRPEVGELVMVNDCSKDGTWETMQKLAKTDDRIRIFTHEVNQGKGAALRTGFQHVNSEIIIIQDADLEYDPDEYPKLLMPILTGRADVVFGSRFLGSGMHRVLYYWHYLGNQFLTQLSNMFTNLNLTDMETCYKVFKKAVLKKSSSKKIDLDLNRRSPPRSQRCAFHSMKCPFRITAEPTKKAKKLAGVTECVPSSAS